MTTRHGDFAFGDAEGFGDQRLECAIGFVVLRRSAYAGFEERAGFIARAAIDAIRAAGRGEADAEFAQSTPRVPSNMPSSQYVTSCCTKEMISSRTRTERSTPAIGGMRRRSGRSIGSVTRPQNSHVDRMN